MPGWGNREKQGQGGPACLQSDPPVEVSRGTQAGQAQERGEKGNKPEA